MLRATILSLLLMATTVAVGAAPPDGTLYLAEAGLEASHEVKDGYLIMRIPVVRVSVADTVLRPDTEDASLFWLELHMEEWRDPGDCVYHFEPSSQKFNSFSVGGSKLHPEGCSWRMKFISKEDALKAFQAVAKSYQLSDAHALNKVQEGDWLPVPDGYVWPPPTENAPRFSPSRKKLNELSVSYRKAMENHWPDDKLPEKVEMAEVDLDQDGTPELFIGIPAYSGTGGTCFKILTSQAGKEYKSIGSVLGWGFQFRKKKNGWFQIEGMSRAGPGNFTRYLMAFGSDGYETMRNEGHNHITGKVTVRDLEDD